MWACLQGLEHRHGRADAIDARNVAGCRDDTATPSPNDHRPVGQIRILALLDGGEERVAIDMGDTEIVPLAMMQSTGRPA